MITPIKIVRMLETLTILQRYKMTKKQITKKINCQKT